MQIGVAIGLASGGEFKAKHSEISGRLLYHGSVAERAAQVNPTPWSPVVYSAKLKFDGCDLFLFLQLCKMCAPGELRLTSAIYRMVTWTFDERKEVLGAFSFSFR